MGTHRIVKLGLVCCAIALLGPTINASATTSGSPTPGVHVDPGSPAGKEYSIPLGSARGNGTNGTSHLFGQGITSGGSPGGGSPAATAASAPATTPPTTPATSSAPAPVHPTQVKTHAKRHHAPAAKRPAAQQPATAQPAAQRPATTPAPKRTPSPQSVIGTDAGSGTGITWMLGAAVIVLLLGGVGGIVLARRGRGASASPS